MKRNFCTIVQEVLAIDKARYLMELKALLSFMDAGERSAVISAYTQLFDHAGEEGEKELIETLGSPVRLVLRLEKIYRSGTLEPYLDELILPLSPADTGLTETVQEAAEAEAEEAELPADEAAPDDQYPPEEEFTSDEPAYTEEDMVPPVPEAPIVQADAPADTEAPETAADEAEDAPEEDPAGHQVGADAMDDAPAEEADMISLPLSDEDTVLPEPLAEEDSPAEEVVDLPLLENDPEESAASEPAPAAETVPVKPKRAKAKTSKKRKNAPEKKKGSLLLAVLCTPPLVVLATLILILFLTPTAFFAALSGATGAAGVYFTSYAFLTMQYIPDLLLVLGTGAVVLGLALLFLTVTLSLLCKGFSLAYTLLSRSFAKLLGKEDDIDA